MRFNSENFTSVAEQFNRGKVCKCYTWYYAYPHTCWITFTFNNVSLYGQCFCQLKKCHWVLFEQKASLDLSASGKLMLAWIARWRVCVYNCVHRFSRNKTHLDGFKYWYLRVLTAQLFTVTFIKRRKKPRLFG